MLDWRRLVMTVGLVVAARGAARADIAPPPDANDGSGSGSGSGSSAKKNEGCAVAGGSFADAGGWLVAAGVAVAFARRRHRR
jgi:MYXO-CTERM domain-containing protein